MKFFKIIALMVLVSLSASAETFFEEASQHYAGDLPNLERTVAVDCHQTEQNGCLEIDIIRVRHNPVLGIPSSLGFNLMTPLANPARNAAEAQWRQSELGPELYAAWQSAQQRIEAGTAVPRSELVCAAEPGSTYVMIWNPRGVVDDARLSEYRLMTTAGGVTRHDVSRITCLSCSARFTNLTDQPAVAVGAPDLVYKIYSPRAGAALQIPWSYIGPSTCIFIWEEKGDWVYPNRQTGEDGIWLTHTFLNQHRHWDYVVVGQTRWEEESTQYKLGR